MESQKVIIGEIGYILSSGDRVALPTFNSGDIRYSLPELLTNGFIPLNIAQVLGQRTRTNGLDTSLYGQWNNPIVTSDGIVSNIQCVGRKWDSRTFKNVPFLSGGFKFVSDTTDLMKKINSLESNNYGELELTSDEYAVIQSKEYGSQLRYMDDTGYTWNLRWNREKLEEMFDENKMQLWSKLARFDSPQARALFMDYLLGVKNGAIPGYELANVVGGVYTNFSNPKFRLLAIHRDNVGSSLVEQVGPFSKTFIGYDPKRHNLD